MIFRAAGVAALSIVILSRAAGAESPEQWHRDGRAAVEAARRINQIDHKARNVILFLGDGMGLSTVVAARIREGQLLGRPGEENLLSFERLPYTALIRTYNTNQQTPDSAGTMTAIVTGVKTKAGVISVNQRVARGDHRTVAKNSLTTIIELAERAGLSTGIVSTARLTHATPAACYAHSPERAWEADSDMPHSALAANFPDIARQLIEFGIGDGIDVALGGGRACFIPKENPDPEYPAQTGKRADGRDLTAEWLSGSHTAYVWNKLQLDAIDLSKTERLLGLFEPGHMRYEHDRGADAAGEPSLSEMTAKAIQMLSKNSKGYFLMVEGARIDHAHHAANAYRALGETIEFSNAVRVAMRKTDRRETLIVVTADHGSPMTMGGYATRGTPILGKVVQNDDRGEPMKRPAQDTTGLSYTVLNYPAGPGYTGASADQPQGSKHFPHSGRGYRGMAKGRTDLSNVDTENPNYLIECGMPLASGVHAGEDVPLYADGPQAHLFHGVLEQNVIFHVIVGALELGEPGAP